MDKWSVYKKTDAFRVAAPNSLQDIVEIKSIDENGIFEVGKGGIFTKMYRFSDINYATASVDEQIQILEDWCKWLNSNNAPFKIIMNNKNKNQETLRKEVLLPQKMDEWDEFRRMYNEEIEDNIMNGRQGIEQELYLIVRYDNSANYDEAKLHFGTLESQMQKDFRQLGSELKPMNANERLRVLHDFYRFGDEEYFNFDFRRAIQQGSFDFKEAILCENITFHEDYFKTSKGKYGSCIYLKQFLGSLISDRAWVKICQLPVKMIHALDGVPISDKDADDMLKSLYLGIEDRIRKQDKTNVKDMNFSSGISLVVRTEKESVEKMIREKSEEDQHFFYTMLNMCVISDSLEQLRKDVKLIEITAKGLGLLVDYSYMRQREALNTILPIGVRHVSNGRNLQTKSLASLFPFNVQELYQAQGTWYGSNYISKNLVTVNRKRLMNPHAMVFGVTGSGKTTACKLEIGQAYLNTKDDIIVIDPKEDYKTICQQLNGAYLELSTTSPNRYNPLEFYDDGTRHNIVAEKTELVLAIMETCKKLPLSAQERSITIRALTFVYETAKLNNTMPTLTDLYNVFCSMQNDLEARDLALYLEAFVRGTLNIFAGYSNVDIGTNRLTVFGMKNLGKELSDISMLIMLECIKERIYRNHQKNKYTWLFIDEFHNVLRTEYSQTYIKSLWMLVRSLGGICTALTQNVTDVLVSYTTKAILENSDFVMILKQQQGASEKLIEEVGLSPEIVKYVTSESESGKGIIRAGNVTVPFSIVLNENGRLFNYIDKNSFKQAVQGSGNTMYATEELRSPY